MFHGIFLALVLATAIQANLVPVTRGSINVTDCLLIAMGDRQHRLFWPGSVEYNATLYIDNKRVVVLPAAVVMPLDENDVSRAMFAAENCSMLFSVVSGGHSAQGYGLRQGGLTINMRSMNASALSNLTSGHMVVTVQAGSRFAELYAFVQTNAPTGWAVVGGGCPQVGLGGFIQGGGWSFVSRSFGLAIDQLHSVRLVLPNRTAVTVSQDSPDQDLWWALRGGGGGNWGIATHFTMHLVQPDSQSSIGEFCWPELDERIMPMMEVWMKRWQSMPKWLLFDPCWLPLGKNKTRLFCFTVVCIAGPGKCEPFLAEARRLQPILDTVKPQEYLTWARANVNVTSAQEGYLYLKSFVFTEENFTNATMRLLIDSIAVAPSPRNLVLFHVGGGAIGEVAGNATAFPHRETMLLLQIKAIWDTPEEEFVNRQWLDGIADLVAPQVTGAYVNYIDARLRNWQTAYYGEDGYARLLVSNVASTQQTRFRSTNLWALNT